MLEAAITLSILVSIGSVLFALLCWLKAHEGDREL